MFRKLFLTATASALAVGSAAAADLPSRRAPPVYVPPPIAAFTWTGAYIGANAGYGWSSGAGETTTACTGSALCTAVAQGQLNAGTIPVTHGLGRDGFVGGGQIGYNYQFGSSLTGGGIVVGVEADAAYTDLKHSDGTITAGNTLNTYSARQSFLGTVRGRVGYAFDRVLLYATGGFAYGETNYAHAFLSNTNPRFPIFSGSSSGIQTGYAVGGGIEYALPSSLFNPFGNSAVTIRAEYLYYDLGTRDTTLTFTPGGLPGVTLTDRVRTAGNLVRAGLNFKFGGEAPAVVARY